MRVHVFGLRYYIDEDKLEETLHKLDSEKPYLLLVVEDDEEFGLKLCARKGLKVIGYVSRFAKDDIIKNLKIEDGYATVFAKVAEVFYDGKYLSADVEEGSNLVSECEEPQYGYTKSWETWEINCPLLPKTSIEVEIES